jgi:hypothetical protein
MTSTSSYGRFQAGVGEADTTIVRDLVRTLVGEFVCVVVGLVEGLFVGVEVLNTNNRAIYYPYHDTYFITNNRFKSSSNIKTPNSLPTTVPTNILSLVSTAMHTSLPTTVLTTAPTTVLSTTPTKTPTGIQLSRYLEIIDSKSESILTLQKYL